MLKVYISIVWWYHSRKHCETWKTNLIEWSNGKWQIYILMKENAFILLLIKRFPKKSLKLLKKKLRMSKILNIYQKSRKFGVRENKRGAKWIWCEKIRGARKIIFRGCAKIRGVKYKGAKIKGARKFKGIMYIK